MASPPTSPTHNPDVLSCLANLSNDEVFTPPELVNRMLDTLPQELFRSPRTTFFDPACKTGVFLREIAKRLIVGLEPHFPDLQERVDHIFHHQLFGIAITELTSLLSRRGLYCTKNPDSEYSVSRFDTAEGNIRYQHLAHSWEGDRCRYCGAARSEYDRPGNREAYAYELLHTDIPEPQEREREQEREQKTFFDMKFDVIISNPPYHLSDGGGTGKSAKAIYHLFVEQAKKLRPRYLTMIIPSRWFSGGKGLDDFRDSMLNDDRIRSIVDYANFREVFPGVDLAGGACYFLWDRDYHGPCTITNVSGRESSTATRPLNEFEVFIRSNQAVGIVHKVRALGYERYLNSVFLSRKPFGLDSKYKPRNTGTPCYFKQETGRKFADPADVHDPAGVLDRWKLMVAKSLIAGQTDYTKPVGFFTQGNIFVAAPGEVCNESWLVAGAFDTEEETLAYKSYLSTKTVRFLLLQTVVSQNFSRRNYMFIPDLGHYEGRYTDEQLCTLWGITPEEYAYIDSRISTLR